MDTNKKRVTHTNDVWVDIPIFSMTYQFYKELSICIIRFPKTKRYTLGQKLDTLSIDLLELLVSLSHADDRLASLVQMSIKLELLKVLLRLAKDTQAIQNSHYIALQTQLQEIGKMLGGWIRSTKQHAP